MSSSLSRRLADEGIDPRGMTLGGSAFQSFADFVAAGGAAANPGPVWIGEQLNYNGRKESNFKTSIYSGVKSATTSVFEQSEKLASGVRAIRIQNNDTTNPVFIGLGLSNSEAENNAESGIAYVNRFIVLPGDIIDIGIATETHCAWLGIGDTVSIRVSQGV